MPISGTLMSVGGGHSVGIFGFNFISGSEDEIEWMSELGHIMHGLGGKLLILFIVLHFVGALKHQILDKDGTLSRMVGRRISGNKVS